MDRNGTKGTVNETIRKTSPTKLFDSCVNPGLPNCLAQLQIGPDEKETDGSERRNVSFLRGGPWKFDCLARPTGLTYVWITGRSKITIEQVFGSVKVNGKNSHG